MENFLKIAAISAIGLFVFAFAIPALAQQPGEIPQVVDSVAVEGTVGGWVGILLTFVRWVYTAVFIVAVLFILMAAFNFITSKGDPGKVKTARSQLLYAIVGIAVALVSYTIVSLVENSLTGGTITG